MDIHIYVTFHVLKFEICGREEIQRIKAANPEMPHREAFSTAAKNVWYSTKLVITFYCLFLSHFALTDQQWAKCEPRGLVGSTPDKDAAQRTMSTIDHVSWINIVCVVTALELDQGVLLKIFGPVAGENKWTSDEKLWRLQTNGT